MFKVFDRVSDYQMRGGNDVQQLPACIGGHGTEP
jgi:hypothetical protein